MKKLRNRVFTYDVLPLIQERWSSRAFDQTRELSGEDMRALLEAASYAPSCFNEQPWRYIVARRDTEVFDAIYETLTPGNQAWAGYSDVLLITLADQHFGYNGKPNPFHIFDAGTAWGYLSLEAQARDILAHCMGGFDKTLLRETLDIPQNTDIISLVALGYYGSPDYLPEDIQAKEVPAPRKPITDLVITTKLRSKGE